MPYHKSFKDDYEDLLHMMKNKTKNLANDVGFNHAPFALFRVPSKNLVKQVVFSPQEKVDWNLECCSEMSIEHEELFQTKGCATRSSPTPWPKGHHNMTCSEEDGTDVYLIQGIL